MVLKYLIPVVKYVRTWCSRSRASIQRCIRLAKLHFIHTIIISCIPLNPFASDASFLHTSACLPPQGTCSALFTLTSLQLQNILKKTLQKQRQKKYLRKKKLSLFPVNVSRDQFQYCVIIFNAIYLHSGTQINR